MCCGKIKQPVTLILKTKHPTLDWVNPIVSPFSAIFMAYSIHAVLYSLALVFFFFFFFALFIVINFGFIFLPRAFVSPFLICFFLFSLSLIFVHLALFGCFGPRVSVISF